MPNGVFESYARGQRLGMQQGQNVLARQQFLEKRQREQEMRNVLSRAYTPGLEAAPAAGPLQPGAAPLPAYPAQEAAFDRPQAAAELMGRGFIPEALQIEKGAIGAEKPSAVREYEFFKQLPKKDQEKYLTMKRAQKFLDIGKGFVAPSMVEPTVTAPVVERELKPAEEPEYKAEVEERKLTAKELATAKSELKTAEATLPRLENVVKNLSTLGKKATYTRAGVAADAAARQLGMKPSEGAIARKEYISMVDNEILPLLKQTFGAAFTEREGQTLKATLGDPDASPEEKDAVLKSFIDSKRAQIETKRRRVEGAPQAAAPKVGAIQGGYVFTGGNPADPKNWKKQ